jgi:hypothetical protein
MSDFLWRWLPVVGSFLGFAMTLTVRPLTRSIATRKERNRCLAWAYSHYYGLDCDRDYVAKSIIDEIESGRPWDSGHPEYIPRRGL